MEKYTQLLCILGWEQFLASNLSQFLFGHRLFTFLPQAQYSQNYLWTPKCHLSYHIKLEVWDLETYVTFRRCQDSQG